MANTPYQPSSITQGVENALGSAFNWLGNQQVPSSLVPTAKAQTVPPINVNGSTQIISNNAPVNNPTATTQKIQNNASGAMTAAQQAQAKVNAQLIAQGGTINPDGSVTPKVQAPVGNQGTKNADGTTTLPSGQIIDANGNLISGGNNSNNQNTTAQQNQATDQSNQQAPGTTNFMSQLSSLLGLQTKNTQNAQANISAAEQNYANTMAAQNSQITQAAQAETQALQPYVAQIGQLNSQLATIQSNHQQALANVQNRPELNISDINSASSKIDRDYALQENSVSSQIAAATATMEMQKTVSDINYNAVQENVNLAVQAATAKQAQNVSDQQWVATNYNDILNSFGSDVANAFNQSVGYNEDLLSLQQSQLTQKMNLITQYGLNISPSDAANMNILDIAAAAEPNANKLFNAGLSSQYASIQNDSLNAQYKAGQIQGLPAVQAGQAATADATSAKNQGIFGKIIDFFTGAPSVTGNTSSTIPTGTDGTAYGFPGYVSNGTQWVQK